MKLTFHPTAPGSVGPVPAGGAIKVHLLNRLANSGLGGLLADVDFGIIAGPLH